MSTRYSVTIYNDDQEETIALFSDKASISAMTIFAAQQIDCGNSLTCPCDNIRVIDLDTGEILFDWLEMHNWDDEYAEPDGIDDDMGFDPYEGCFTYDC